MCDKCYVCGKELTGRQTKYCSKTCQMRFRRCYNCGKVIVKDHFLIAIRSVLREDFIESSERTLSDKIEPQTINTKAKEILNVLWFSKHVRLLCCTCMKLPYLKQNLGMI